MLLLLALTGAFAIPDGYKVTKEDVEGCTLMLGPKEADGVVPMRAECHWPDVGIDKFDAAFEKWEDHDLFFSSIAASDVLSSEGDTHEVSQVHVNKGISDRVIILTGTRTALDGGGFRYAWSKSTKAEPEVPKGDVAAVRSDGFWEAKPAADGGIDVVHQLSYDPGGSVPGFIVRWFQTGGLATIVTDLHTYMTTH